MPERKHTPVSYAELRRVLTYEPATGVFTWRVSPRGRGEIGNVAGYLGKDGRRHVGIDGRYYKASRLAVLWMTGEWPAHEVDHRDGDPSNDTWNNLRVATHSQNCWNARKRSDSKSGFKGVCFDNQKQKYRATIAENGKGHHLGFFDSPEIASLAYKRAARKYHGDFRRTTPTLIVRHLIKKQASVEP